MLRVPRRAAARPRPIRPALAAALANAFLAGGWDRPGLVASGKEVLGRRAVWLPALADEVLGIYPTPPRDGPRELTAVVASRDAARRTRGARPVTVPVAATVMVRNPWHLPRLDTVADLAALLRVTPERLDALADLGGLRREARPRPDYRVVCRPSASGAVRVLEVPADPLKALQRRLLRDVLSAIPAHDAAHAFRSGRSVATGAAPHAGQQVVVRLDLEGFFASVTAGRVYGVLRTAGYPEPVAHCLTGLLTTVLPRRAWAAVPLPADPGLHAAHWRLGRRLAAPHLPQGSPTSPVLANLAAYRLDVRLSALAGSWGGRYTRYADDLVLSGDRGWGRGTSRLLDLVAAVVVDEGFRLNARKTAVLPRTGRQVVTGLVVNDRPRVARREVDLLRAVLHHCAQTGPAPQNRDRHPDFRAYLTGRVAWVAQFDPVRGARLQAQLAAVDWADPAQPTPR